MAQDLFVYTRKGLLKLQEKNKHWEITNTYFLGEPVSMMLADPTTNTLFAAINFGHFGCKLHRSEDNGNSWEEIKAPSYEGVSADAVKDTCEKDNNDEPNNAAPEPPSLQLLWCLEKDPQGKLWAGTIPGGLFSSDDNGDSWQLNRPLWDNPSRPEWFGGGYDQPGIHSICIDPRNAQHLSVAISCGGVWQSQDGGKRWSAKTSGMRADYLPPEQSENPAMQDPHRMVQCAAAPDCFWIQHHNGIFRSVDNCNTWQEINAAPSSFGFAVAVHPSDANTAWFVPGIKDEKRIPVDGQLIVNKTTNGGKSFTALRDGLPQQNSFDLIYRHGLAIDATGNTLAMGSTTGNLWISNNGGSQWKTISHTLPPIYGVCFVA